jgi:hypothetical protein
MFTLCSHFNTPPAIMGQEEKTRQQGSLRERLFRCTNDAAMVLAAALLVHTQHKALNGHAGPQLKLAQPKTGISKQLPAVGLEQADGEVRFKDTYELPCS